jgi:transcriptional regulator with XRE-family HTH domain
MRYYALIFPAGDSLVAEFPDCPGCVAVAGPVEDIGRNAAVTLRRWLEAPLFAGGSPPLPSRKAPKREGCTTLAIKVPPLLGLAVAVRHARHSQGMSLAEYARSLRISESQVAKLEHPAGYPTARSIQKAAKALGVAIPKSVLVQSAQGELFQELVAGDLIRAAPEAVAAYGAEASAETSLELCFDAPVSVSERIHEAAAAEGTTVAEWLLDAATSKLSRTSDS